MHLPGRQLIVKNGDSLLLLSVGLAVVEPVGRGAGGVGVAGHDCVGSLGDRREDARAGCPVLAIPELGLECGGVGIKSRLVLLALAELQGFGPAIALPVLKILHR